MRVAFKEATWVFGLSRLLMLMTTLVAIFLLPQYIPVLKESLAVHKIDPFGTVFFSWLRWDDTHFLTISIYGYKNTPDVVFFPLWPLIQHFGGLLLGGVVINSYYLAGILLANICFYFALVFLYLFLAKDFEAAVARRTLLFLAFAPYALFFFAGYTESLFLLLCVACFYFLQRGQHFDWWLAGLMGLLATLTRSSGLILGVPFVIIYLQHFWTPTARKLYPLRQQIFALLPLALIPLGGLGYMVYLYFTKGNAFLIGYEESSIWQRHFSLPWNTIAMVTNAFITSWSIPRYLVDNILFLSFTFIFIGTLILGWKRIPWHYRLFALALAAFTLSFPVYSIVPLSSQPRYLLVIFPVSVIFARWANNRYFYGISLALSLVFLVIYITLFVDGRWVA